MPPYTGPSKERGVYSARFVRVGDRLFTAEPDDSRTSHQELAIKDGVHEEVWRLKWESPSEVDAGKYHVFGEVITVDCDSMTLGLPIRSVRAVARNKTISLFKSQSTGYKINKGSF